LKIKIDLLELPLIGVGMLLRLTGGNTKRGSIGLALAGFGVLFLGIDVLRTAFTDLSSGISFPDIGGFWGIAAHVVIGALLTLMMQSSSAATALVLTAAQGGLLGLEAAAAVVIGSNIGTTGTALIAAIGATANARRAAAAHVLFNLLTGCAAFLTLPWLLQVTQWFGRWIGAPADIATALALFHSVFNLLGVLLMWPLSDRLAAFLEARFRSTEEDEAKARYLDAATAALPALAIDALNREVSRYGSIAVLAVRNALMLRATAGRDLPRVLRTLAALDANIDAFVVRLNRAAMTQETAQHLTQVLRRSTYYRGVAEQLPAVAAIAEHRPLQALAPGHALLVQMDGLQKAAAALLQRLVWQEESGVASQSSEDMNLDMDTAAESWERNYQQVKAALLEAGALGTLAPAPMELVLRSNSALRRALQQTLKAWKINGIEHPPVKDA
jgi:phosphate:Na+ symporter